MKDSLIIGKTKAVMTMIISISLLLIGCINNSTSNNRTQTEGVNSVVQTEHIEDTVFSVFGTKIRTQMHLDSNRLRSLGAKEVIEFIFENHSAEDVSNIDYLIQSPRVFSSNGLSHRKCLLVENYGTSNTTVTTRYDYTLNKNNTIRCRQLDIEKKEGLRQVKKVYKKSTELNFPNTYPDTLFEMAEESLELFGWVDVSPENYKLLSVTKNYTLEVIPEVTKLLREGVLSCYYKDDTLILFEYFDRNFMPKEDRKTFYYNFLVGKEYNCIQEAPSVVFSINIPAQSSNMPIFVPIDYNGFLYKNEKLLAVLNEDKSKFMSTQQRKSTRRANTLLREYYQPLLTFIQQNVKPIK